MIRTIPGHRAEPPTLGRRIAVHVLGATGVWYLLPGLAQGRICRCARYCADDRQVTR